MNYLLVAVLGVVAGILSGLFGIGGAILIVPALVLLVKLPQHTASGTSLAALLLPAGPPAWPPVEGRLIRDPRLVLSVGVHHIDLEVAVAIRDEGDLRSVRRPIGVGIPGGGVGELGLPAPVGVHHIDLVVAVAVREERDLRPVRRPGGTALEPGRVGEPR